MKSLQFGILSEEEISRLSVAEVTEMLIYDKEYCIPMSHGINDPKMGVCIRGLVCQTCSGGMKQCPGHFGHIKLMEPVFHPEFLKTIIKILKCICFKCTELLVREETVEKLIKIKSKKKRLNEMVKAAMKKCEGTDCQHKQPSFTKMEHNIKIRLNSDHRQDGDNNRIFLASEAQELFKKMNPTIIDTLGLSNTYSHPKSMIINLLIVAPPSIRPSVELASSSRSEDDLTHMYKSILNTNKEIEKAKNRGASDSKKQEYISRLQAYVTYLMNNDQNKAKQKGGRPIKSISQRLKGKEGRLRGNLMGKRVDFSARTVVSPDPSLELDQLGVPKQIAQELTVPERVTNLNIDFLKSLVDRGDEWPGARYYISKVHDTEIIDLNYVKEKPNLQYGDIVERHLMDDDYVIFNRQPSLHKMSIMGHRIKVLPFSTFRLNLAVTNPYNADFDGDEMNMHVPQNLETTAEVKHLMHVPKQIVTPQSNKPVMGLNQDALLAIRLLTLRKTFITKDVLFDLLMYVENWDGEIPQPAILKPKPLWTGKQIISFIIPQINYTRHCDNYNKEIANLYPNDTHVIIRNGQLLVGSLDSKTVANKKGSLIGCLWIDFGPNHTKNFLTYSQRIVNCWLLTHGFTVGIADTIVSQAILDNITETRKKTEIEFRDTMKDSYRKNKKLITHQHGKTIIESFENKVNTILNNCRSDIGKYLSKNVTKENNIRKMILAGSKGNNINISQISGLVGQQNVEGKRIPFGFLKRSLPHFLKDDFGPESRGFVANSYYKGLSPQEFFFHTMGGREGLIDTAVKTSKTGYMQRKLVKAMEDIMVQYDYSVRDSKGNIVQFLYGEDGIAAEFIENQRFMLLKSNDAELQKGCCFFEMDEEKHDDGFEDSVIRLFEHQLISENIRNELLNTEDAHITLKREYDEIKKARDQLREYFEPGQNEIILPVNVERLISQNRTRFNQRDIRHSELNPITVFERTEKFLSQLKIFNVSQISPARAEQKPILKKIQDFSLDQNEKALYLFKSFLRFKLASKKVILQYGFRLEGFEELLVEIMQCFNKSKQHPGEVCGSIAAQSIGETLTQMTLNTFHFAGVSALNVTLGVPRIQEILDCAKNIKSAIMTIYMKNEYRREKDEAIKLINILENKTLSQLAIKSEIYFDNKLSDTIIHEDKALTCYEDQITGPISPWVLRIELEYLLLVRFQIKFPEIVEKIKNVYNDKVQILESPECIDINVIRIRLREVGPHVYNKTKQMEQFILEEMAIKGFCSKVSYKKVNISDYNEGKTQQEHVLETSGNELYKVLLIPSVDSDRSFTNDIFTMIKIFGIEAGRLSILREIRSVFTHFSIYVNYRHIGLLADIITCNGSLMAISRNGINKVYTSPLKKSSFEQTVEVLIDAAIYADLDPISGVSENIMMGQLCKIGTGCFDVLMDNQKFFNTGNEGVSANTDANFMYIPDPTVGIIPDLGRPANQGGLDTYQGGPFTPRLGMNTPGLYPGTPRINSPFQNNTGAMTPNIYTPGNFARSPGMLTPGIHQTPGQMNSSMYQNNTHGSLYTPYAEDRSNTRRGDSSGIIGGNTIGQNDPFSPIIDNAMSGQIYSPHMYTNNHSNSLGIDSMNRDGMQYTPQTPGNRHMMSPTLGHGSPTPLGSNGGLSGPLTNSPHYSPTSNPLTSRSSDRISSPMSDEGATDYNPISPHHRNTIIKKEENLDQKDDEYSEEEY